ncbi:hypothetical protein [Sphingomonas sp.]|jgi:hypothetical protein|uniref:hypothetical protein n=1 Tax=Sphingomonas sp. TaxID=28214 RepID=UPI0025CE3D55|nr:hypothetical protein [Sphingomonas sp.]
MARSRWSRRRWRGGDAVGLWVEPKEWTAATTRDTRTALADLYPRCRRACH